MTQTALITGAAKRLGRETALKFARQGWHVIIHYNYSSEDAVSLQEKISADGGSASLFQFDLSNIDQLKDAVTKLIQNHPTLSILVNNASIFDYDFADEANIEIWQRSQTINMLAPVLMAQTFAKHLRTENGCIINILDQKLANMNPDYFSYTLSKSGLASATSMMAMAFQKKNIRVCNVAPGLSLPSGDQTNAEFERSSKMNLLERTTHTSEIADGVFFIANSDFSTGQTLFIDSGQRLTPHDRDVMFLVRGA